MLSNIVDTIYDSTMIPCCVVLMIPSSSNEIVIELSCAESGVVVSTVYAIFSYSPSSCEPSDHTCSYLALTFMPALLKVSPSL